MIYRIEKEPYSWAKENNLIAHAFGGISGTTYTNSLDAFKFNYSNGFKIFEVDLVLSSDDHLVLKHDWSSLVSQMLKQEISADKQDKALSLSEFKTMKIHGWMEPLSFEDVIEIMDKDKDIYIVTDTKDIPTDELFGQIVELVSKYDINILKRIIPQIYNEEMYYQIKEIYNFDSYIYTLYQTSSGDDEVISFMKENNLKVVTAPTFRMTEEFASKLNENNIYIYVHTINAAPEIKFFKNIGVYGFYTDFITPKYYESILKDIE
ncbi:MAG: glycerophosphodiester phosphodiesterase [Candidatus Galacturonibacter soehngenii]|nr:glycerophosphodiester phosphodiesterase [Candidatus Galacturonibacter soehngenii]